jgi:hypothetical protein
LLLCSIPEPRRVFMENPAVAVGDVVPRGKTVMIDMIDVGAGLQQQPDDVEASARVGRLPVSVLCQATSTGAPIECVTHVCWRKPADERVSQPSHQRRLCLARPKLVL